MVPLVLLLSLAMLSAEREVAPPVLEPVPNAAGPAVATDGTDYLAVWQTESNGVQSLSAARIAGDGRLLDPLPRQLGGPMPDAAWFGAPEVRFVGGRYLVTRTQVGSIEVLAVERDGTVAAAKTIGPLGTGAEHRTAASDTRMLVAWDDGNAAIVDRELNVLARMTLSGMRVMAAAAGEGEFLVLSALHCAGTECPRTIVADRFSIDGVRLSSATLIDGAERIASAAATHASGEYVVFAGTKAYFLDGSAVSLPVTAPVMNARALTDRDGNAVLVGTVHEHTAVFRFDPRTRAATVRVLRNESEAAVAFAAASTLLVSAETGILHARFVDSELNDDASRAAVLPLSVAARPQDSPAIATNGERFLVTWVETARFGYETYGALFDRNGKALTAPLATQLFWPRIASDGRDFLLVGYHGGGLAVQKWSAAGAAALQPIAESAPAPVSIWNGTHYVVFLESRGAIDAIRLTRDGEVVDRRTLTPLLPRLSFTAASNGERTMLVWRSDAYAAGCRKFCTPLVHFDALLLDRDNEPIRSFRIGSQRDAESYVSGLAAGGGEFLLTWWTAGPRRAAFATAIDEHGGVVRETQLDDGAAESATAAWNGRAFDTVWISDEQDVLFRRGEGEPAVVNVTFEKRAAIASIPNVATLVAYSRTTDDAVHGATTRVFLRTAPVSAPAAKRRAVR